MTPPYAAELRVYEPLGAFDVAERRHWQEYAQARVVPSARELAAAERLAGLVAACRTPGRVPRPGEAGEHASVLRGESGLLVCPRRTEPRCWEAAVESRAVLPPEVAALALPDDEVELAAAEHQRWLAAYPARRPHVRQSRWAVPVHWFLLFDREERRLQLGPRAGRTGGGVTTIGRSLVYRTAMAQARRRVARGLGVLRKAFEDAPMVGAVESTGRWLEEFHPRAIVELDYGGLVDLRADADLRADDSAGDVATALAALARGDTRTATDAYERVMTRWRVAHQVESEN